MHGCCSRLIRHHCAEHNNSFTSEKTSNADRRVRTICANVGGRNDADVSITSGQAQVTHGAVAQIGDGQIQAGMQTKIMMPMANQINDGQIQIQTTLAPVAEFKDGQPQAPTTAMATPTPVSEAPAAQMAANPAPAAPAASPASNKMVACATEGNLEITLANNILKDSKGRTGYIASNFQFQFDAPPQSESIFTAGFSFCGNGSLALGGSNIFYQCLSGDFYNLYDRHWAQQCNAVTITVVELQQC